MLIRYQLCFKSFLILLTFFLISDFNSFSKIINCMNISRGYLFIKTLNYYALLNKKYSLICCDNEYKQFFSNESCLFVIICSTRKLVFDFLYEMLELFGLFFSVLSCEQRLRRRRRCVVLGAFSFLFYPILLLIFGLFLVFLFFIYLQMLI